MHQSLINKYTGEVLQIVGGGTDSRFEVHEDFMWVTGPEEVEKGCDSVEYRYNMGSGQVERKPEAIPPYDLSRRVEFFNYEEQLDMLWHDIDEGRLPGKETSKWYAHIKAVKEQYPKP